ncbi:hypothetical protein MCEMRE193_00326 [Candidatus Nanopelagicaceae bacterium]
MFLDSRIIKFTSYAFVAVGIVLGALSFVRSGSLLIALGTLGIAFPSRHLRTIEFYFPVGIAVGLFVLAISLPHGL